MSEFKIFDYMEKYDYEQLVFFQHKETGLKAVTCIHNTLLGPALGGTRFWNYKNEDEAIEDALRLARGMTFKNSMAGLLIGGGKTVVWGDTEELRFDLAKAESFWRAFGRFVEGLGGRYITAADVGIKTQYLVDVNKETNYVVGLPGKSGSPSPYTAFGVFRAIEACCEHLYDSTSVEGKVVAVQGAGAVAYTLCEYLKKANAKIIVTDIDKAKVDAVVRDFGAASIDPNDIYGVDCDIYAPCALGATVNDETIPQLKCKIICGAANNVLKDAPIHGKALKEKGIVYAPDYVVNAGGVINVSLELREGGYDEEAALHAISLIYNRTLAILKRADETGELTHEIADKMAVERIDAMKSIIGILK
jgi:leucine dehydrogenase